MSQWRLYATSCRRRIARLFRSRWFLISCLGFLPLGMAALSAFKPLLPFWLLDGLVSFLYVLMSLGSAFIFVRVLQYFQRQEAKSPRMRNTVLATIEMVIYQTIWWGGAALLDGRR